MKFCADDRLDPAGEHHGYPTGDADNQQGVAHDCIGQSAFLFVERLGLDDHWGANPLDAAVNLVPRLHDLRNAVPVNRSDEHPSELPSLLRISYAVFCLKNKKQLVSPTVI